MTTGRLRGPFAAQLLVAVGAVGGHRFCWRPLVLVRALALYSSPLLVLRLRTPLPPQSQLTPPQPHAQHAGFSQLAAGGRLMRQDAWQQQAAQRLSSRSTALAQREEECRGWPNGHPGMRAGEAPLTRLACHAGYKGGGRQCGERRRVQPGWLASVSQILSAAVNQRNIAFPCDVQPVRHPTR